jgi:o-succinylbenzoate synthase
MRIDEVELRRAALPLVTPFRTSFGTQSSRDVLLVRAVTDVGVGWGECVALPTPAYSSEYVDGAEEVITRFVLPRLFVSADLTAADVAPLLAPIHGHRMAKAAVEMALLDAELRGRGESFATAFGATATRVPCGVSVGMFDDLDRLLAEVAAYVDAGYVRVKLKIEPGHDVAHVAAVRDRWPDLPLQVDANAAYRADDADHRAALAALDAFDLLLIEQPFAEDRLHDHAALAQTIATPVCLDETITSVAVCEDALRYGAAAVVNIKAGRVGGYLTARRIAEVCAAHGAPAWCGGMVETGLGRAANVALAAGPEFTLPGDVSASGRFFARDLITAPFEMVAGHLDVPTGPGLGVEVDEEFLASITTSRQVVGPEDAR